MFNENYSQEKIYQEVKPFVHSALDGKNVCIFAYGQTGSGKTYTMQGPEWIDPAETRIQEMSGIMPRTGQFIFEEMNYLRKVGYVHQLEISCFEIYCDEVRDLQVDSSCFQKTNSKGLKLLQDKTKTLIEGLTWKRVKSASQLASIISECNENKTMKATVHNNRSSRAHTIFQIRIRGGKNGNIKTSILNIIDLAGSERRSTAKHGKIDRSLSPEEQK